MPQIDLANLSNIDIPLSTLARTRVYEQSFENGITDLIANNCSQEITSEDVYAGQHALKVTVSAGETGYVETPTRPVSPNQLITFSFAHKENEYVESIKLAIVWKRASGGIINIDEFSLTPSTLWQLDSRTITAPKNAVSMAIRIIITAKSDGDAVVYIDDITMDLIGQILRVDNVGNVMTSVQNLDEVMGTDLRTLTDIYNRLAEKLPRTLYDSEGNELSNYIKNLNVGLSTRASESTLQIVANRLYNSNIDKSVAELLTDIKLKTDKLTYDENNLLKINLAKSDVTLSVSLKDTSIVVPIDIQKTTIDVPIKIKDSTINVPISIKESAITLPVKISDILKAYDSGLDELKVNIAPRRTSPTRELSSYSLGANSVKEITKTNLNGYSAIVVTVRATYNSSATKGVRIRWLYSPDGSNYDSPEDAEEQGNYEDLTFEAGRTKQRTVLIPIFTPYVKIQIVNLDSSYSVTIDVWTTLLR